MDLLILAARAAEKRLEKQLAEFGLTYPQFQVLRTVRDMGASTIGAVADSMLCSRGNLTGVADRLERDGWIERRRSEEDRRVVNIVLLRSEDLAAVEAAITPLLNEAMPREVEEYLGGVAYPSNASA